MSKVDQETSKPIPWQFQFRNHGFGKISKHRGGATLPSNALKVRKARRKQQKESRRKNRA